MPTLTTVDDDWTKTTNALEKRRIQNRLAQRNYRNNIKRRLKQLEQLDRVLAKSGGISAKTLIEEDENENENEKEKAEEVVYQQQHASNTMAFPVSQPQPLITPPDHDNNNNNNCSWLAGSNDSVPELQMDMASQMEFNQFMFGLNLMTPHTPSYRTPTQPFDYFTNHNTSGGDQDPNATGSQAFDRQTSGQATLPPGNPPLSQQSHTPPALARTRSDTAIQTMQSIQSAIIQSDVNMMSTDTSPPKYPGSSAATPHNPSGSQSYTASSSGCSTPLHQAAANGHVQIVRFLVMKGAHVTARNECSQTVLHLAAERGHDGVIEQILQLQSECEEIKASIGWIDDQGFTALHRAAAGGHEECVRVLVEAGAEIESSKQSTQQLLSSMFSQ